MTPSASQAERIVMSNALTTMPPRAADPSWDFGTWDNSKTSTPPWSYRGFWYHGKPGASDRLVVLWRWGFDEGGYLIVCGDIYQCTDGLEAILLWRDLKYKVDELGYDGVFIFYGNRRMSEVSVYGEVFPEPLPNGRWL